MTYFKDVNVIVMHGLTFREVKNNGGTVDFIGDRSFQMYHSQDCCESVGVHDMIGDLNDLLDTPILDVKEEIGSDWPSDVPVPEYRESSFTWTIFTITTAKGVVIIRWLGESNGYYSESVSFTEL